MGRKHTQHTCSRHGKKNQVHFLPIDAGANGGKEIFPCSADHKQDWQPYAVDLYSAVCHDHTYMYTYIVLSRVYPQLPPVIGAPWGLKKNLNAFVAGTLRGYFLPVRYGSVGVQLTRLRALYQGTLTSGCVWKNLNTSYLYNAAILASFFLFACLKACFRLSLSTRNKKKRTITSKKHVYRPETSYYVLNYSLKRRGILESVNHNIGAASA